MKASFCPVIARRLVLASLVVLGWGSGIFAQTSNPIPVVTVQATQPFANVTNPAVFTVFRAGDTNLSLQVWFDLGGTATNGVDYAIQPGGFIVEIPAGTTSNSIFIAPTYAAPGVTPGSATNQTVVLTLAESPSLMPADYDYAIGSPSNAMVCLQSTPGTNFPVVSLFSPTNGAVFYAPTNLQIWAQASELGGRVTNVEFFAGTNDLGAGFPLVTAPQSPDGIGGDVVYYLSWRGPSPGSYALTARTTDNGGRSAVSAPVNIQVVPGTNLPVVSISSPTNGAVFYAPTNLQIWAQASELGGRVTNMEFFAGTNDLGAGFPLVTAPQSPDGIGGDVVYYLSWRGPSPGSHALTARATDNGGRSAVSTPVNIQVLSGSPTNRPVVRIISPPDGSVFHAPINVPLLAFASDTNTVVSVRFFAGSNSLGFAQPVSAAVPPGPPGPGPIAPQVLVMMTTNLWGLVWTNASLGANIVLTAEATDHGGASTISQPEDITVLPSPPPPTNRLAIVEIVATDPIAIEGTNCWVWRGETNYPASWANWPAASQLFTNCGPKAATFTVRRLGDTNDDLAVAYTLGGTATNGVDYLALPGSVTIPAGGRGALISLVPIDDGPPDVNKTVVLTLTGSTNYSAGHPGRAAAIILDGNGVQPGAGMLPGGCFHLAAPGPNAAWFSIEYSTDMVKWTPACTNQIVNGSIDFVDPDAPVNPARFYRALPLTGPPAD